jgi:hypothetical protein
MHLLTVICPHTRKPTKTLKTYYFAYYSGKDGFHHILQAVSARAKPPRKDSTRWHLAHRKSDLPQRTANVTAADAPPLVERRPAQKRLQIGGRNCKLITPI